MYTHITTKLEPKGAKGVTKKYDNVHFKAGNVCPVSSWVL